MNKRSRNDWFKLGVLGLMTIGSYAALSTDDARLEEPSANPIVDESETVRAPMAPAGTVREPADDRTPAERADPDGGFEKPPVSEPTEELPPDLRETADFDVSFPVDI
ncbi:MAG: hypothetical protein NZM12_00095 [Steroidobacteraceae bacterium]|nr:hypothetical protein [Steroidobacteraceae bacterium]MDW8258242.1 hypothetical protein [Gammaproteobacteria bacterium]